MKLMRRYFWGSNCVREIGSVISAYAEVFLGKPLFSGKAVYHLRLCGGKSFMAA